MGSAPVETSAAQRTPRTPWLEILVAALPAMVHAVYFLGRLHPDEVFQSLEPALQHAYGFGITAWEWNRPPQVDPSKPWGIRNHAVPLLFAGLLRVGDALGISSPMGRRTLLALPQWALHAAMLGAVWRLAFRRVGAPAARAVVWLIALYAPIVWFAGRTMSEAFSAAFLVWGLERLDSRGAKPGWWALGGFLLGCAQITRYGSAAVIVPALVWLLVERRFKAFALAALGGGVAAFALGLLDFVTWGEWFHSLIHYLRYNVTSGEAAAAFGAGPWWAYVPLMTVLPTAAAGFIVSSRRGPTARWALIAGAVMASLAALCVLKPELMPALSAQSGWLGAAAGVAVAFLLLRDEVELPSLLTAGGLGYTAILCSTPHKEPRFLYPALVLLSVAGTVSFVRWAKDGELRRRLAGVLAVSGVAFFLVPSPYEVQRKEQFQFIARNAESTTGLVILNEGLWGSTGFFYLGKNLPWCTCDFPQERCFQVAMQDRRFNRGLFWENSAAEAERTRQAEAAFQAGGFHLVERRGQALYFSRD